MTFLSFMFFWEGRVKNRQHLLVSEVKSDPIYFHFPFYFYSTVYWYSVITWHVGCLKWKGRQDL